MAKAKESAYKDLYHKLDSIEWQKIDLTDIAYIKDSNGTILTYKYEIKARWKESFETLLKVENEREEVEPTDPMQGPIPSVNDAEIRKQLSKMGKNKACGPDDLSIEAIMVVHSKNKLCSEGPYRVLQVVPNTGPYLVLQGTPIKGASKDPHAMVL